MASINAIPGAAAATGGAVTVGALAELIDVIPNEYGPAGIVVVCMLYLGVTAVRLNRETLQAIDARFDAAEKQLNAIQLRIPRDLTERIIRLEERSARTENV